MRTLAGYTAVVAATALVTVGIMHGPKWLPAVRDLDEEALQAPEGQAASDVELSTEERDNVRIYQMANRGVVNITNRGVQQDDFAQ